VHWNVPEEELSTFSMWIKGLEGQAGCKHSCWG